MVDATCFPTSLHSEVVKVVLLECKKIIKKLKLKNGIFHVQFIFDGNVPIILEICRRHPGDLYLDFVSYHVGFDYGELVLKGYLNEIFYQKSKKDGFDYVLRFCVMGNKNGLFKNLKINKSIEGNILKIFMLKEKNSIISNFKKEKIAIIFFKFDSYSNMKKNSQAITNLVYPVISIIEN